MPEKGIIERIKKGDKAALKEVYLANRELVFKWLIKQFKMDMETALEIYQFTILRFYDSIMAGRYTEVRSKVSTYLCEIAKNIWREHQRAIQKDIKTTNQLMLQLIVLKGTEHIDKDQLLKREAQYENMERSLSDLGNPCKELLESYYYLGLRMKAIASKLGYKNADVAKNLKGRCLRKLKIMMSK